jgi:YD repeat-containing protein
VAAAAGIHTQTRWSQTTIKSLELTKPSKVTYDGFGRPTKSMVYTNGPQQYSSGTTRTTFYDALGRTASVAVAGPYFASAAVYTEAGNSKATLVNAIGHLTQATVSGGSSNSYTAFDPMGRITAHTQQTTTGHTYPFAYAYDLAGNLVTETYPSGRVVQTGFDAANRAQTVNGVSAGQKTIYVRNTSYVVANNLSQLTFGSGAYRFFAYNQRLQL